MITDRTELPDFKKANHISIINQLKITKAKRAKIQNRMEA
jgi:hypothetical protein